MHDSASPRPQQRRFRRNAWPIGVLFGAAMTVSCAAPESRVEPLSGSTHALSEILLPDGDIVLEETTQVVTVAPRITITENSLWIADGREAQVRRYSKNGELLQYFGRRGSGPGEMNSPLAVFESPDGILVLEQGGNVHLWTFDGSEMPSYRASWPGIRPSVTTDAALLEDGRVLRSTRVEPVVGTANLGVRTERVSWTATAGTLESADTLPLTTFISEDMLGTYSGSGYTLSAVRGDVVAAVVGIQDTVRFYDLGSREETKVVLPTGDFRHVQPFTGTPGDPVALQPWLQSFSTITSISFVADDVVVVQYRDVTADGVMWHLLGMSTSGAPLFQLRDAPVLLAWDPYSERFLGRPDPNALPNELRWYSLATLP